ncbi:glutathione S-transferase T1-like [Henckelia pumila]|uniref:glutathione S-transferase T1-like n=1 Tax=Henckelia pumila TaxID=405737 RepID=UPI003C6E0AFD
MKQVPAIVHGDFKLFERYTPAFLLDHKLKKRAQTRKTNLLSGRAPKLFGPSRISWRADEDHANHAILIYLSSAFPGVADHWYDALLFSLNFLVHFAIAWSIPADVQKRAKVHSVLDWHHSNLRLGSAGYALNSATFGLPSNPKSEAVAKKIAEAEKVLSASLATIESFWLQEDAPFLLGNSQPSIADLALACEVMQIVVVDEEDRGRILGPHKRILKWIEDVKNATEPYFDELHSIVLLVREKLKERRSKLRPNYEEESA